MVAMSASVKLLRPVRRLFPSGNADLESSDVSTWCHVTCIGPSKPTIPLPREKTNRPSEPKWQKHFEQDLLCREHANWHAQRCMALEARSASSRIAAATDCRANIKA